MHSTFFPFWSFCLRHIFIFILLSFIYACANSGSNNSQTPINTTKPAQVPAPLAINKCRAYRVSTDAFLRVCTTDNFRILEFKPVKAATGSGFEVTLTVTAKKTDGTMINTTGLLTQDVSRNLDDPLLIRTEHENYRFDVGTRNQLDYLRQIAADNRGCYFLLSSVKGRPKEQVLTNHLCYDITAHNADGSQIDLTKLNWWKADFFSGLDELNPRPPGGDPQKH